jgi:hypothetical protein
MKKASILLGLDWNGTLSDGTRRGNDAYLSYLREITLALRKRGIEPTLCVVSTLSKNLNDENYLVRAAQDEDIPFFGFYEAKGIELNPGDKAQLGALQERLGIGFPEDRTFLLDDKRDTATGKLPAMVATLGRSDWKSFLLKTVKRSAGGRIANHLPYPEYAEPEKIAEYIRTTIDTPEAV